MDTHWINKLSFSLWNYKKKLLPPTPPSYPPSMNSSNHYDINPIVFLFEHDSMFDLVKQTHTHTHVQIK
ncbi:unnamed protein product [Schistosoma bovis]|nr:unnamed protein product [Schistosoma bovis]